MLIRVEGLWFVRFSVGLRVRIQVDLRFRVWGFCVGVCPVARALTLQGLGGSGSVPWKAVQVMYALLPGLGFRVLPPAPNP